MTDILELETRRKIYDVIKKNPGVNLSTIADRLQISSQLIDYHLHYLEQHELITITKEAGYKRCYIKGDIGAHDKQILSLLRQEIPLKIILYLLRYPHSRHRDILQSLGISSPHFSYHLRKLLKHGIIEHSLDKEKQGYIVRNKQNIIALLIRYKPTTLLENIEDTWKDFLPG